LIVTAVSVDLVLVIALFVAGDECVSADRVDTSGGIKLASGLAGEGASGESEALAVLIIEVGALAVFGALDGPVAALGVFTQEGISCGDALPGSTRVASDKSIYTNKQDVSLAADGAFGLAFVG
jgi:hypothetical protein